MPAPYRTRLLIPVSMARVDEEVIAALVLDPESEEFRSLVERTVWGLTLMSKTPDLMGLELRVYGEELLLHEEITGPEAFELGEVGRDLSTNRSPRLAQVPEVIARSASTETADTRLHVLRDGSIHVRSDAWEHAVESPCFPAAEILEARMAVAPPEEARELFQALVRVDGARALSVVRHGIFLYGGEGEDVSVHEHLEPADLQPLLQSSVEDVRRNALAVLDTVQGGRGRTR